MSPLPPPPSWSQGIPTLHLWFFGGYFTPQPTLFPGQAIATAWSFQGSSDIGTNLGLRVLLDGALLYTPSPLPFTGDTGQRSMSIPPPTDPTLAKSLYTPGLKKLALEITGNGQHPGPYLVNAAIETKPETLDNTWWSFGGSPSSADWKSDYAIVGSLSDMGHGAALSGGTITLLEAEAGSTGPALARGTVASPALSAGATSGLLSFPVINQDWRWFDSLLMVPVAPTFKFFLYSVAVSVQDQFGNQNMATIGSQSVFVSVSNDKNWAAAGAMGAAAAAVVTLIAAGLAAVGIVTAWAAPELFAVAAGLYTVAQSLAAEANDPPEPDPR